MLEISGVKFVKANAVARELGYTSDYVGQLCRSGKINAQLVGRSWYVDRDSIKDHKQTRYRSTKKKSAEALKSALRLTEDDLQRKYNSESYSAEERLVPQSASKHFYKRDTVADSTKYSIDESELIPTLKTKEVVPREVKETHGVEVVHADAKKVVINKTSNNYVFSTTPKPSIQFTGNITIAEVEEEVDVPEEVVKQEEKIETQKHATSVKKRPHKLEGAKVSIRTLKNEQSRKLRVTEEVDNVQHVVVKKNKKLELKKDSKINDGGELIVRELAEDFGNTGGRYNFVYITASLVLSLTVGLCLVALEQSFTTAGVDLISSYSFNISTVLEAF